MIDAVHEGRNALTSELVQLGQTELHIRHLYQGRCAINALRIQSGVHAPYDDAPIRVRES
jgi:hypothetical protein